MAEPDKYEVIERIGHGSFGIINKVRRKSDGFILCRKEVSYKKMSQKEKEQLQAELSILKELKHPNIVEYYEREHLKDSQYLHLYMEYCGNGDLGQVISEYKARGELPPENFVWSILAQLVSALYRCHNGVDPPDVGDNLFGLGSALKQTKVKAAAKPGKTYTVLHRDLKPDNVFLDSDNNVKLGDFGLSKIIQSHDFASTYVGTPYYMSPEICGAERYSVASDIWSLGCLIYELCTQRPPFTAQAHAELYAKIKKGVYSPLPPQYSAELAKVVASCLQVNFHLRPTAAELLALPVICLVRKQHEAVQLHKQLRKSLEEVERAKTEIDETLRKEWEVRAQGEINRVVREEKQRLNSIFEAEVGKRVAIWAAEHAKRPRRASDRSLGGQTVVDGPSSDESPPLPNSNASSDRTRISDESQSFIRRGLDRLSLESPDTTVTAPRPSRTPLTRAHTVMAGQTHIASPMDIQIANPSPMSLESPDTTVTAPRPSRTPLTRAHTVMAGQTHIASPMDIQMADPSPMSIVSLSLSPRKDSASTAAQAMSKNIIARGRALAGSSLAKAMFASDDDSDEGGDEATDGDDGNKRTCSDSPSCEPSKKMRRRASAASNMKRLMSAPALAPAGAATAAAAAAPGPAATAATARRPASAVPVVASSPTRARKAGATAVAGAEATSPTRPRKAMFHKPTESGSPARKGLRSKRVEGGLAGKMAAPRTANTAAVGGVHGRTLIELAQARAGGVDRSMGMGMASPVKPTMWDPERDEMPSPFLARGRARHM